MKTIAVLSSALLFAACSSGPDGHITDFEGRAQRAVLRASEAHAGRAWAEVQVGSEIFLVAAAAEGDGGRIEIATSDGRWAFAVDLAADRISHRWDGEHDGHPESFSDSRQMVHGASPADELSESIAAIRASSYLDEYRREILSIGLPALAYAAESWDASGAPARAVRTALSAFANWPAENAEGSEAGAAAYFSEGGSCAWNPEGTNGTFSCEAQCCGMETPVCNSTRCTCKPAKAAVTPVEGNF